VEIFAFDPTRLTKPKSVRDFRLRGSVCAGITGRFVVSVAQVSASSNAVDGLWHFSTNLVVVERWESGKRAAFSKAVSSPPFPRLHRAANSAGVRSSCGMSVMTWSRKDVVGDEQTA
jgi:hypothetical protein